MNATVLFDAINEIEPDIPQFFLDRNNLFENLLCDKLMGLEEALELDYDNKRFISKSYHMDADRFV